jgi:hypothetical protein
MNHQPFREWLLSDTELSAEQTQALKEHLHSCESCTRIESAWMEVDVIFHKAPHVTPSPGFSARWQVHLAEYQNKKLKQREWWTVGSALFFVTSLLAIIFSQLWSLLQAPGPYLVASFNRLIGLVSLYYTFQEMIRSFSGNVATYTFVGIFFLVGTISFMSVLWLAAYRKLSLARRVV